MEAKLRKAIQKIVEALLVTIVLSCMHPSSTRAQLLDMMEEAEVRNPDDFIGRFNANELNEFIKYAQTKTPDGTIKRRELLSLLFNRNQAWNDTLRLEFVNYIDNKYTPRYFNIEKDSLLAEINTVVEMNHENVPVKFILSFHSEPNKQRWEIVNIQSALFSKIKVKPDSALMQSDLDSRLQPDSAALELKYYIIPSDHNVDFMDFEDLFTNPHFLFYCSAKACISNKNIQLFNQWVKNNKVTFRERKTINLFFVSWPVWKMKISYVSNSNNISGWLITGLYKDSEHNLVDTLLAQ